MGGGGFVDRGKVAYASHNRVWICFDARTGKQLWKSEQAGYPWGNWWAYNMASYDFNESKSAIIGTAYDGIYAFDWDNGKILWHYSSPMIPFEDPYGTEPFFTGVNIADGKVYAFGGEHSPSQPVTRGWHLHCINATTGEGIWKITGPMTPGAVADGYLTASDPYDGYMYVFGKGKSATTITTSPAVIAKGATVLIQGTVLDQSPAQPGTPCVSAATMETQMEYLHMQHPIDGLYHNETITGVPVILTAIGSDGTVTDIGTTTTNGYYGAFGYAWTPPKEDTYTIMASFAGDDSYGSSTAATFLLVGPAPASPTPTPTVEPQPAADYTPLLYGILVAVVVAIVIGLLALFRKR
jgi:outer membrane protein assembly factor BamB